MKRYIQDAAFNLGLAEFVFRGRRLWGIFVLVLACESSAFTFETAFSRGCHEELTLRALSRASWPQNHAAPAVTRESMILSHNLPFRVSPNTDFWSLAMLVGVRDNDTAGYSITDLTELAGVHNGSHNQDAHCLRSPTQKYLVGDEEALKSCRAFIQSEVALAVGGNNIVDLQATEKVRLSLRYQEANVSLSRYAFHMGRAIHALQDSFSHSFRLMPEQAVVSVLNFVDYALSPNHSPGRDGHAHMSELDTCEGVSAFDQQRIQAAEEASYELLQAVAQPVASSAERAQLVEAVLDKALSYSPGCSEENSWCGTLENLEPLTVKSALGCTSVGENIVWPCGTLLLALGLRASSRRSSSSRR